LRALHRPGVGQGRGTLARPGLAALALALRESPRRGRRRGTRRLRETPAVQTPPCGCLPPAAQRLRGGAPSIMLSRVGARPGPSTLRGASAAGRSESSTGIACAIVPCSYMYHVRACCACAAWRGAWVAAHRRRRDLNRLRTGMRRSCICLVPTPLESQGFQVSNGFKMD
jgi:hypothetical protein